MITKQSVLSLSYGGMTTGSQSEYHCIVRWHLKHVRFSNHVAFVCLRVYLTISRDTGTVSIPHDRQLSSTALPWVRTCDLNLGYCILSRILFSTSQTLVQYCTALRLRLRQYNNIVREFTPSCTVSFTYTIDTWQFYCTWLLSFSVNLMFRAN